MKKTIKLILLAFIANASYAQEYKATIIYPKYEEYGKQEGGNYINKKPITRVDPISFNQYDMEGATYFEVSHCIPGSDVAFYSTNGGGRVLKTVTTDKTGKIVLERVKDFSPAFAVNLKNKNKNGVAGNGMVDFTSEKLFTIQDIELRKNADNQKSLTWKAMTHFTDAAFEVQRSTDDNNFKTIATLEAKKGTELNSFSITDDAENYASYRIMLVNRGDKSAYFTRSLQLPEYSSFVKLYPSPVSDKLNIMLAASVQKATYTILDNSGKVTSRGSLTQKNMAIPVGGLAKGIYFIKIVTDNKTETKKFIKD